MIPEPGASKPEWRAWARTLDPVPAPTAHLVRQHVAEFVRSIEGFVLGYEPLPDEVGLDLRFDAIARLDETGDLLLDGPDGPLAPRDFAVALVPGRVFDRDGYRLGRGGGHYDRLVPALAPGTPVVGITCTARLVDRVPREAHDRPMTHLATEHTIIKCG